MVFLFDLILERDILAMKLIGIFLGVFIILVLFLVLLDLAIKRLYKIKKNPHSVTPHKFNIPFEEIQLPVEKSGHLYGWWIPASTGAPVIILVHGWGRNLSRMLPYIREFHAMGYNLLAFDARSHGSSSSINNPTVWTFTQDTCAAVSFVAENYPTLSQGIGAVGLSIGGGAVINAASLDQRIQSVITIGAFSHPIDVMKWDLQKKHIPHLPFGWFLFNYMRLRLGMDFNKIAPINNIQKVAADIFLIHGEQDTTTPIEQGAMLENKSTTETTLFWAVPGKGHSDCSSHPQFWNKIKAFLQKTLLISPGS